MPCQSPAIGSALAARPGSHAKNCLAISLCVPADPLPAAFGAHRTQDGVYLENIAEQRVHSEEAVLALLSRGSSARTKGETQVTSNAPHRHRPCP